MDNVTLTVNSTLSDLNGTSTRGPTPLPATPPPVGYYGETRNMLWKVMPPIIIVWGTVGNLLTFLVLLRQKSKLSSTAMYLMALAISDTVILFCGPLRQWISQIWDYDVRFASDASCKIQIYITYASIHCSSWLLVAVTVERAMSVVFPHKVKLSCTPRKAGIVIISIVVFMLSINSCNLVIYGSDAYRSTQECAPTTKDHLEFRDDIYHWFDFFIAFALPFLFLLAGNIIIIVYLQKSRANRKAMAATRGQGGAASGRDTRSVSVLMIALCAIFLFTMTPVSIFNLYYPEKQDQIFELFKTDPYKAWYDYQYGLFQQAVVNLVGYTNASFNFILYVFSGTKFRKELRALFHCDTAGTSGVFGSKVANSSSKTGTTSLSARGTQLHKNKQIYLEMESKTFEGNDVQTPKKSNGIAYSTDTRIREICEKETYADDNLVETGQEENAPPDYSYLPHSNNSEFKADNKIDREMESTVDGLESTGEQDSAQEGTADQIKRDEHNVDGETASVNAINLNVHI